MLANWLWHSLSLSFSLSLFFSLSTSWNGILSKCFFEMNNTVLLPYIQSNRITTTKNWMYTYIHISIFKVDQSIFRVFMFTQTQLLIFHFIWDIDIRDNNSKCRQSDSYLMMISILLSSKLFEILTKQRENLNISLY